MESWLGEMTTALRSRDSGLHEACAKSYVKNLLDRAWPTLSELSLTPSLGDIAKRCVQQVIDGQSDSVLSESSHLKSYCEDCGRGMVDRIVRLYTELSEPVQMAEPFKTVPDSPRPKKRIRRRRRKKIAKSMEGSVKKPKQSISDAYLSSVSNGKSVRSSREHSKAKILAKKKTLSSGRKADSKREERKEPLPQNILVMSDSN